MLLGKIVDQVVIKPHQLPTPHEITGGIVGGNDSQNAVLLDRRPVTLFLFFDRRYNPLTGYVLVDAIQQLGTVLPHCPGDAPFTVHHRADSCLAIRADKDIQHVAIDNSGSQFPGFHSLNQFFVGKVGIQNVHRNVVMAPGQFFCGFLVRGPFRNRNSEVFQLGQSQICLLCRNNEVFLHPRCLTNASAWA